MRLIKEAYGESDDLDDFVDYAKNRFRFYYRVTLARKENYEDEYQYSDKYFYSKDAAEEYYDKILKDMKKEKDYYQWSEISLTRVDVRLEEDELKNTISAELDDDILDDEIDNEEEIIEEE